MKKQLFTIAMCLSCAMIYAQDDLKINTYDAENHQKVKSIWVIAERIRDKMRDSVMTDKNGVAVFKNLKEDEKYCIYTKANTRYENSSVRVILTKKDDNLMRLAIYKHEEVAAR